MHINSLQNMKRMINNKSGSPTHLLHNKKNYLKTRTPILLELKSLDQQSLIWWECSNFYSHPRELRQGLSSTARLFSKLLLFTSHPKPPLSIKFAWIDKTPIYYSRLIPKCPISLDWDRRSAKHENPKMSPFLTSFCANPFPNCLKEAQNNGAWLGISGLSHSLLSEASEACHCCVPGPFPSDGRSFGRRTVGKTETVN